MPNSTASPMKRPGLGRRAISSHAVVTRSSSSNAPHADLSGSHSSSSQKLALRPHHHYPRTHVVGGHRHHNRNPSFGKNLAKLQRHLSAHQIAHEPHTGARQHQRKKSAPVTPAASPRAHNNNHHVRWEGVLDDSPEPVHAPIKKNNSSPVLRRRHSSHAKATVVTTSDRPQTGTDKKKTVGFELGDDSDNEDGEWEDTTQSPESTRRSSVVAQSKDSVENHQPVIVDPLTFVKRPVPQFARAASLPESVNKSFDQRTHDGEQPTPSREDHDHDPEHAHDQHDADDDDHHGDDEAEHSPDHPAITSRLLTPSLAAKAPPAMSSISATAKPAVVDALARKTSLSTLNAGTDGRRPTSSSHATTPARHASGPTQATSSSIEGGVSRFIMDGKPVAPGSFRTDSEPNTPSSFLPHYPPQTPPSPHQSSTATARRRASPPPRSRGVEPPSRTQQKLWLQRTATLNTSPPDSHGASATASPAALDPSHSRPGAAPFEASRGLVNGAPRPGTGSIPDGEAKHIRKAYEKTAMELTVVRRFQSPTADSFQRLAVLLTDLQLPQSPALGPTVQSAPTLPQDGKASRGRPSARPEPRQLLGRRANDISQAYLDEAASDTAPLRKSTTLHPSHRLLSTSAEGEPSVGQDEDAESSLIPNESEMLMRRLWESREVATSG